jgi:GR25 family glycosyltransferase involved in LPS biosynthesis
MFSACRMITMPGRGATELAMLEAEGLEVVAFPAVPLTDALVAAAVAAPQRKQFSRGQVGCYLSHRALWQELCSMPDGSSMLILEDDVRLPAYHDGTRSLAAQMTEFMARVPSDWGVVFFGRCWDTCSANRRVNANMVRTRDALCMHAYALTKSAAEVLLEANTPMTAHVDVGLRQLLRDGTLSAYARTPQFLEQNSDIASTLQTRLIKQQRECTEHVALPIGMVALVILLAVAMISVLHVYRVRMN